MALTEKSIFRLPWADEGDGGDDSPERRPRPVKKRKASGPRRIKEKERALVGQQFEEDGTNWKVLDVAWSEEVEPAQVVVYYYDLDLAEA